MELGRDLARDGRRLVERDESALGRRGQGLRDAPDVLEHCGPRSIQVKEEDQGPEVAHGPKCIEHLNARFVGREDRVEVVGEVSPAGQQGLAVWRHDARERECRLPRARAERRADGCARVAHWPTR